MENAGLILLLTFGLIVLLLFSGMWISLALGLAGIIIYYLFIGGMKAVGTLGFLQFNIVNVFTFTMFPIFIFMGEILLSSGMSDKLYRGATPWVGFLPGGLLHTNIAACAIFSAVSGSSMATAATIGTVAVPELEKRGYSRKLLLGSLAAGGTLGILIPPSAIMVIYGVFVNESIGKLFMGGVFPGIILAGSFMLYIASASIVRPGLAPERIRVSLRDMVRSIPLLAPVVALIFLVMGTIYLGLATPTESAAMGATGALIFCALYRKLTWQVLRQAGLAALQITAWAMFILVGAQIIAMGLAWLGVTKQLAQWVASLGMPRLGILVMVSFLYLVLGCFMDGISMMLLTLPVIYPIMMSQGFDSVWFGIMMVIFVEMGQVTPPVGVNLFVIHGISGRKNFNDIVIGITPFLVCMVIVLIVLTAFPNLALWLPSKMVKKW